jgi:penicillin amidase
MRLRKAVCILIGLFVIASAAFAAWKIYFLVHKAEYNESFSSGVNKPVIMERDRSGNPMIRAAGIDDAWYALGYCHAFDRLPVMEYYRSLALGNSPRVLSGEDGVILSRLVAALGIVNDAESLFGKLDDAHRRMLESYTAGINTAKKRHGRSFLSGDRYDHAAWKPQDVLAVAAMDSWVHAFLSCKELQFAIPEKKIFAGIDDFIPRTSVFSYKDKYADQAAFVLSLRRLLDRHYGGRDDFLSVYLPEKEGEKELFAVASFKPLSVYPRLMNVSIDIGGVRYLCITKAGSPFPVSSVSDSLRYSAYPLDLDSVELYLLSVEKKDGVESYLAESEWRTFLRGSSGAAQRSTYFGPVISDASSSGDSSVCVATDRILFTEKTVYALLDAPFAANSEAALARASAYEGIPFLFFMTDGRRTISAPVGKLPRRTGGDDLFRERDAAPQMVNLSGYLKNSISAKMVGSSVPDSGDYAAAADYISGISSQQTDRIRSVLDGEWTKSRILAAAGSTVSERDTRIAKQYLKLLGGVPITSGKLCNLYLSGWDGSFSGDSKAPLIFNQMGASLASEILTDELGPDIRQVFDNPDLLSVSIEKILGKADSKACDNIATPETFETFDTVFSQSFIKAVRYLHRSYGPEMDRWSWSRVHKRLFPVPFVRSGLFVPHRETSSSPYAAQVLYSGTPGVFGVREIGQDVCIVSGGTFFQSNYPVSCNPWSEFSAPVKDSTRLDDMSSVNAVVSASVAPAAQ